MVDDGREPGDVGVVDFVRVTYPRVVGPSNRASRRWSAQWWGTTWTTTCRS